MTPDRDMDRLLGIWLDSGPDAAPDRMLDILADRIERQRQRPAWRLDRRPFQMHPYLKLGAAVAAVLIVAIVGWNLLPGQRSVGGPAATPSPAPTATPLASAAPLPSPEADLAAGRYEYRPGPRLVSFEVPSGWRLVAADSFGVDFVPIGTPGTTDGDTIKVFYDMRPASRDDHCQEVPEPGFGSSAHELLSGVASTPGVVATAPQSTDTANGRAEVIDVTMAPSWTHACPFSGGQPTVPLIVDTITTAEGPFWGLGPREKERLVAFDVEGWSNVVVVIDSINGSTFESLVEQAMPFVRSFDVQVGG
jgi:hypothetical protein